MGKNYCSSIFFSFLKQQNLFDDFLHNFTGSKLFFFIFYVLYGTLIQPKCGE